MPTQYTFVQFEHLNSPSGKPQPHILIKLCSSLCLPLSLFLSLYWHPGVWEWVFWVGCALWDLGSWEGCRAPCHAGPRVYVYTSSCLWLPGSCPCSTWLMHALLSCTLVLTNVPGLLSPPMATNVDRRSLSYSSFVPWPRSFHSLSLTRKAQW